MPPDGVAIRRLPKVVTREDVSIALVDDSAGVPNLGVVEVLGSSASSHLGVCAGEVVWFEPWMGREIGWMGEVLVVVNMADVVAVLEEVPEWVVGRLEVASARARGVEVEDEP